MEHDVAIKRTNLFFVKRNSRYDISSITAKTEEITSR